MAMSMTGYGRGESLGEKYQFVVEAKSVNNRYLEIFVKLPRSINYLEEHIKQTLKKYVSRGKVEIFIKLNLVGVSSSQVDVDLELAQNYLNLLKNLDEKLGLVSSVRSLDIAKLPDVMKLTEAELDKDALQEQLDTALEMCFSSLKDMRLKEGQNLCEDVKLRCGILQKNILEVEKMAVAIEEEQRERLITKMTEIMNRFNYNVDEQRVVQEAAILADKSNVTEEIVRFNSHIIQLMDTFSISKDPIGRKLDFILQEMNREVNTIGSKSMSLNVTDYVIILKAELEKIREQIQNLE